MTSKLVRKKKTPPPTFKGHYAGFVTRLVAFVIDILIVSVTIGVMLGTMGIILRFFNVDLQAITDDMGSINSFLRGTIIFLTSFGFTFIVNLVYTTFFWVIAGKTIGKAVMGLRVIGPKGSRVTMGRAFRRYVGYWISALPLFLGYFWVLIDERRHGWHDIMAGTSVIYDREIQYTEGGLGRLAQYAPRLEAKMAKEALADGSSPDDPVSGPQNDPASGPQKAVEE